MSETAVWTEDLLCRIVEFHTGQEPQALTRCSTGKFNTTWFVDGVDPPLVLRIAPPDDRSRMLFYEHRMMRQEPDIHGLLRARTTIPVPRIVAADFTHALIDRDFLLMERLPGLPVSDHPGLSQLEWDSVLRAVGDGLRQAHAITASEYGYIGPHRPMEPQPDWAHAFLVMWNLLIDDIERCGGYDADEASLMRRLLDRHLSLFDRPVPASLLHMDVWSQNILADGHGRLTGLVDWDRALFGDPEIEFAVLDYCGISEPAFWEGYGAERDTSTEAEIRRCFYLLYEVQKYIVIRRARDGDPRRADQYRWRALALANQIPR